MNDQSDDKVRQIAELDTIASECASLFYGDEKTWGRLSESMRDPWRNIAKFVQLKVLAAGLAAAPARVAPPESVIEYLRRRQQKAPPHE